MRGVVVDGFGGLTDAIRDLAGERRLFRLQMGPPATFQGAQQFQEGQRQVASTSAPQITVTEQAVDQIQKTEGLNDEQKVALIDIISGEEKMAKVYLSLNDGVRRAWVSKRLADNGFVMVDM